MQEGAEMTRETPPQWDGWSPGERAQLAGLAAETWTAARAKAERPEVTVCHCGMLYRGAVTGNDARAHVTIRRSYDDWQTWEWSWATVAHSLNSGRPLTT